MWAHVSSVCRTVAQHRNSAFCACSYGRAIGGFADTDYVDIKQEGQHPRTGQRAPPISGGTYRRRMTLIDGYLESPFPTACLL